MNRVRLFALLIALSAPLCAVPVVQAQTKPAAAKLPSAASVLDDSAKATGGIANYNKIKSMVITGTMQMIAQNISGSLETRLAFPNKVYSAQEIKGIGKFEQGYDGATGWSRDPINGLRTLAGAELTQIKTQGDEMKSSDWRRLYSKVTLLGIRKVGTANAYAIRLFPKSGAKPVTTFFDTKTKLPIRTDIVAQTAQGEVPSQNFTSDFRTVSGIKIPFKTRQVSGTQEVSVTFDSVQVNVPIDNAIFAKPVASTPKP